MRGCAFLCVYISTLMILTNLNLITKFPFMAQYLKSSTYIKFVVSVAVDVAEILLWRQIDLWPRCGFFVFIHILNCRSSYCILYKDISHL